MSVTATTAAARAAASAVSQRDTGRTDVASVWGPARPVLVSHRTAGTTVIRPATRNVPEPPVSAGRGSAVLPKARPARVIRRVQTPRGSAPRDLSHQFIRRLQET